MKHWHKEPLLHFLLIGAAIFALFYQVTDPESLTENRIVISENDVDRMITLFEKKFQRLPSQQELSGLVESHIREEVLYREALAMGLDQDDTIVRRRMAQKLEFMFNDLADAGSPDDDELQSYLMDNPDKFMVSSRISFNHVYLNSDKRGSNVHRDADELLRSLALKQAVADISSVGDVFMFGNSFESHSEYQISRMFGSKFSKALEPLETGRWLGPVDSSYGLHLIYITAKEPARLPPLDEVRDSVLYELMAERRQQADKAFYQALRDRYDIIIEQANEQINTTMVDTAR